MSDSEESSDEVRAQMHAIQENETAQLRELTALLELETKFVQQYLNVLEEVKAEWHDEYALIYIIWSFSLKMRIKRSILRQFAPPRPGDPTHIFQRLSRDSSVRSGRSGRANFKDSDDDHASHRSTSYGRPESRASSRPTSRASRKRAESASTIGDREKGREKPRRKSVTGWASSAVESVTGRGKKNKEKFATLPDDENKQDGVEDTEEADPSLKRSGSFSSVNIKRSNDKLRESLTTASPKPAARILKPPSLQEKKMVRALYSFSGATDELSFKAGDEIIVVSEVLDGWWMGELSGKRGLFPTTHAEVLPPGSRRAPTFRDLDSTGGSTDHRVVDKSDSDSYLTNDMDNDRDIRSNPSIGVLQPDTMSITSSIAEDDDNKRLMPFRHGSDDYAVDEHYFQSSSSDTPPGFTDRKILYSLNSSPRPIRLPETESTTGKKAPPPPPPRRPTNPLTATPPIPYRPYRHTPSQSVNSLKVPASLAGSRNGYDRSPFESATELATPASGETIGCGEFKQNPFQAKGMCSNCFQFHGP